jgi:hypothetical protein
MLYMLCVAAVGTFQEAVHYVTHILAVVVSCLDQHLPLCICRIHCAGCVCCGSADQDHQPTQQ